MSPELTVTNVNRYAALGRRFQAFRIDLFLCLGVFLIGGIVAGILLENHPGGRTVAFFVLLAFLLGYEPFMVSRYGGTLGHRKANIRISCAESDANLPLWRAAARSLFKQVFGLFSFFFMFITYRAQGLHDILAGATVIIRNPLLAGPGDYFCPRPLPSGQAASPIRRIVITVVYNVLAFLSMIVVASTALSPACLNQNACFGTDDLVLSVLGGSWLVFCAASIIFGWTGRLPGCRPEPSRD
jgi:uncharacterized RDD family membrane protein YckC